MEKSKYTLNDYKFSNEPLTLFVPDPNYEPDEEELQRKRIENKKRMERFNEEIRHIVS